MISWRRGTARANDRNDTQSVVKLIRIPYNTAEWHSRVVHKPPSPDRRQTNGRTFYAHAGHKIEFESRLCLFRKPITITIRSTSAACAALLPSEAGNTQWLLKIESSFIQTAYRCEVGGESGLMGASYDETHVSCDAASDEFQRLPMSTLIGNDLLLLCDRCETREQFPDYFEGSKAIS